MANILLLGSDRARVAGIRSLLRQDRHRVVSGKIDEGWRAREAEVQPELIIAAIDRPESMLAQCRDRGRGFPAPLLFIQSDADFRRELYLDNRLVDRINGPFMSDELLARVEALINVRRVLHRQAPGAPREKRSDGRGVFGAIASLLRSPAVPDERPIEPALEVASRMAAWADQRDAFDPGHAERVSNCCAMIAEGLGLGDSETTALLRAAALHDIGKVALPAEVLRQKGPLEEGQMRMIRTHPRRGAALLRVLDRNDDIASTVLYHHERPDGSGYYGLEGDRIPRSARILALAEVFDAMTSSTVTERMIEEDALAKLESTRGQLYDGECVDALRDKLRPRPTTISMAPLS